MGCTWLKRYRTQFYTIYKFRYLARMRLNHYMHTYFNHHDLLGMTLDSFNTFTRNSHASKRFVDIYSYLVGLEVQCLA